MNYSSTSKRSHLCTKKISEASLPQLQKTTSAVISPRAGTWAQLPSWFSLIRILKRKNSFTREISRAKRRSSPWTTVQAPTVCWCHHLPFRRPGSFKTFLQPTTQSAQVYMTRKLWCTSSKRDFKRETAVKMPLGGSEVHLLTTSGFRESLGTKDSNLAYMLRTYTVRLSPKSHKRVYRRRYRWGRNSYSDWTPKRTSIPTWIKLWKTLAT